LYSPNFFKLLVNFLYSMKSKNKNVLVLVINIWRVEIVLFVYRQIWTNIDETYFW